MLTRQPCLVTRDRALATQVLLNGGERARGTFTSYNTRAQKHTCTFDNPAVMNGAMQARGGASGGRADEGPREMSEGGRLR